jgi:hypothetical protein
MAGLKGFQRKTVHYVFDRMYAAENPATRFLVADEVGLGKTLVARGLIAKTIAHLQEKGVRRIDVIYICSNADIANQNIQRLNVTGERDFSRATRITMLPLELKKLDANGLNFVSLTPGTSFNMASRGGIAHERAVVMGLLERIWGADVVSRNGGYRLMAGNRKVEWFRNDVAWIRTQELDKRLTREFKKELGARKDLRRTFTRLARRLDDPEDRGDWNAQWDLIRDLRLALAKSCVAALEPDLVILDEFQRFRELLQPANPDDPDDIRALAHHLFEQQDVRMLLLSATPYKMYTLSDEGDDDHYADFLQTTRFLLNDEAATKAFGDELRDFRRVLMDVENAGEKVVRARKRAVERRLRSVMVRTERLAVTSDRNGMLTEHRLGATALAAGDLRAYATADRVSRRLRGHDPTDYWKSAPYLLNFMESYKLKRELRRASEDPDESAAVASEIDPSTLLSRDALEAYEAVDPGNARLRGLVADIVEPGAWQLLWMPPSLPYYESAGAYAEPGLANLTKRLVFSSWSVVPPAIASLVSYDVERRMMGLHDSTARNDATERAKRRGLLALRRTEDGAASMSTFGFLYPSPTLAALTDPLAIARGLGAETRSVGRDEVLAQATARLRSALAPLTRTVRDGPEDQAWYWAAPLLLDARHDDGTTLRWLKSSNALRTLSRSTGTGEDDDAGLWLDHVDRAARAVTNPAELGRAPGDLAEVLALIGVGGPGNAGLRAVARVLARVAGTRVVLHGNDVRDAAVRIAWGFRSLYNIPEVMALIRAGDTEEGAYWRRAASHGVDGNLQAVLDEFAHILPEWLGLLDRDAHVIAERVAAAIHDSVSIRATNYSADEVRLDDGGVSIERMPMRVRFALRFGADAADDDKQLQRSSAVRTAFNSPFWPFVLASTSVGQEGLDFHQYCHAVVHWNLPANPVDLEQREGRVHRYKGHAIRKNVASRNRAVAFGRRVTDPWTAMFDAAAKGVGHSDLKDIEPYWVYTGPATIERHVPMLPLSREVERFDRLIKSLAAYRMVFGQPRQEDLIAYIGANLDSERMVALEDQLRINLEPT